MKRFCLQCDDGTALKLERRDVTLRSGEESQIVPGVFGWHCPKCGEVEFESEESAQQVAAAFHQMQMRARRRTGDELRGIRKKLKLTQIEAAQLTGGGKNAFSRYERGEAEPMAAVINLFRLLDRHPELLKEMRKR